MGKPNHAGRGNWKAKVIPCGDHITRKTVLCAGFDDDLVLRIPYQAFLLQNNGFNVLIDNGQNERHNAYGQKSGEFTFYATSEQLLESLEKEGLVPDDIDLVLYTHLHADHAGNANFFPKTKTVAQKAEYENLLNPCFKEIQLALYDQGTIPALRNNPNFTLVDGDVELMEGIRLVTTPGHTRGHQAIVVNTVNGLRIFAGDQFHLPPCCFPWLDTLMDSQGVEHKITPAPDWPAMPSNLVFNYYDYYASCGKLKALMPDNGTEYMVCGHDASLQYKDF
jgi:glyoxylase-like metal-dependent hydrolase (beta-lactamase superfamily II)